MVMERWKRYLDCATCGAPLSTCNDLRWYWKYHGQYRWTMKPHPGRRHM